MSWDSPGLEEARLRRGWLVSPAIATLIFFGAQLFLARYSDGPHAVHGAAAETPAIPVNVRVVAAIKSADDLRPSARVPESESELLELFKKQGAVVFSSTEVEKIGTQAAEFDEEVITADTKLRRATFRPR